MLGYASELRTFSVRVRPDKARASCVLEHGLTNSSAELAFSVELCTQQIKHPSSPTVCKQLESRKLLASLS